ncbi:hypothetical protein SUGI_0019420 [Cryptomeria japonica]|uniref:gibberellic acid methyltransferase 2-like n=1 Tax=Cryptomeria japonica TaxID=3369 RepID=UPI002408B0B5|nr:gibberellic acid methyltransferase 2-like [Cryptomeria japonica]GLJ05513.1 hypothetical protein SUGI_0019420 [Cryptomeria japonica]
MEIDCMKSSIVQRNEKANETENKNNSFSSAQLHGVLHMYSGNGDASYAENSTRQRHVFHVLQPLFQEAIEKLTFPKEGPLRIADLGCATGLNTISDMDFVVSTLTNLCNGTVVRDFQAFFSDLPSNDFNGLFSLLDRCNLPYFVAGVPGSFYNVLFPHSSIHVCYSIMALHWISQVPEAVLQKDSPLYNRGRVWINRGEQEVVDMYSKQSQKDLTAFLKCRAEEMATGGVLFLCLMGRPDTSPPSQQVSVEGEFCGQDFEDAWDDLVMEGIISADLRDSFNLPWYFPNAIEVREAVEKSGAFEIERLEVCEGVPSMSEKEFEQWVKEPNMFAKMKANLVKSFVGSLVEAHIGIEHSEMFFQRFEQRAAALLHSSPPSRFATCTVASLIRK